MSFGELAFGEAPFADDLGSIAPTVNEITILASTHPFISSASDTPAKTYFESRLLTPLTFERSIVNQDGIGAAASLAYGDIELDNTDGFYDSLVDSSAIDGRRVRIKLGGDGFDYSEFGVLFDGSAVGWDLTESAVVVHVQDNGYLLKVPIARNFYGGSGGADGDENLDGKPKPQIFGEVLNISAVLIDSINLVYQVNDGAVKSISAVYDRGVALTPVTGYTVDLAAGTFTLLNNPSGTITADVEGSNTGSIYVANTADIILRIIKTCAGFDDDAIDLDSFSALATLQPAVVGYFVNDDQTVEDVITELLTGIGAYYSFTRDGLLSVARFEPAASEPVATYTKIEVQSIGRLPLPNDFYPPSWRVRVAYQRNWTVQTSDLETAISNARRLFLTEEYRLASAQEPSVKDVYLLAQDTAPITGFFAQKVDAEAEALRVLTIRKQPHYLFQFSIKTQALDREIGDVVLLAYPRWNLDLGRSVLIVGLSDDCPNNETAIKVFL